MLPDHGNPELAQRVKDLQSRHAVTPGPAALLVCFVHSQPRRIVEMTVAFRPKRVVLLHSDINATTKAMVNDAVRMLDHFANLPPSDAPCFPFASPDHWTDQRLRLELQEHAGRDEGENPGIVDVGEAPPLAAAAAATLAAEFAFCVTHWSDTLRFEHMSPRLFGGPQIRRSAAKALREGRAHTAVGLFEQAKQGNQDDRLDLIGALLARAHAHLLDANISGVRDASRVLGDALRCNRMERLPGLEEIRIHQQKLEKISADPHPDPGRRMLVLLLAMLVGHHEQGNHDMTVLLAYRILECAIERPLRSLLAPKDAGPLHWRHLSPETAQAVCEQLDAALNTNRSSQPDGSEALHLLQSAAALCALSERHRHWHEGKSGLLKRVLDRCRNRNGSILTHGSLPVTSAAADSAANEVRHLAGAILGTEEWQAIISDADYLRPFSLLPAC